MAVDDLLASIAEALARNRAGAPALVSAALAVALFFLLYRLGNLLLQWREARRTFERLAASRDLGLREVRLVRALAGRARAAPALVLTQLEWFERATAGVADPDGEIRRLRRALRFDRLPAHAPLLTTRELAVDTPVALLDRSGRVVDVDEGVLAVEVDGPVTLLPGRLVALSVANAREARYALRCQLLSAGPRQNGRVRLEFAHDEKPARVQRRSWARVPASGALALRPLAMLVKPGASLSELPLDLVDVSAGGALVCAPAPMQAGTLGVASFSVGGVRFDAIRARVLASAPVGVGWRTHLQFVRLAELERQRLVVAVQRQAVAERRPEQARAAEPTTAQR